MPVTNLASASSSDLASAFSDYAVPSEQSESADGSGEYRWQNTDWPQDYGHYLNIPEFKTAVDAKAIWTIGAGFEADPLTMLKTSGFKGYGKDSFNSILKNMMKVKTITGDSFAEIVTEGKSIVNLKPLDPSSIVIVYDKKGRIKRYEQVSNVGGKESRLKFPPHEIFHLCHDRIADEVHGTRILKALGWLIKARNEAMSDWKIVLHRNVRPMRIWYLDTDDEVQIAAFKQKTDRANADTENMYVPKGTVETEIASVAPNQTLSPLQWIEQLNDYFFQAVMVPQILFGNAKSFTDASGKIVYLAYEQSVKAEQLYIEEQVLNQLNLEIQLTFPASLQNELLAAEQKSPISGAAEPNDMTTELEGRK